MYLIGYNQIMKEKTKLSEFELSQYLDSKEMIAEYLIQVLKDGDMDELWSYC